MNDCHWNEASAWMNLTNQSESRIDASSFHLEGSPMNTWSSSNDLPSSGRLVIESVPLLIHDQTSPVLLLIKKQDKLVCVCVCSCAGLQWMCPFPPLTLLLESVVCLIPVRISNEYSKVLGDLSSHK